MLPLQVLIAWFSRSLGRLFNTAFGWATILLFGKVPHARRVYLSGITFGSILWITALLGTISPSVGTFLLSFLTVPNWVDLNWVRAGMLAGVMALPIVVGIASLFILPPEDRPSTAAGRTARILHGFPYTIGVAITLVMLIALAPILKLRNFLRRWTDQHVPVIVESDAYLEVLTDAERALAAGGFPTQREPVGWMLRTSTRVLTFFAGDARNRLVANHLTRLVSPRIEVLVHPSDLVISGRAQDVARARAILSEHLTFTKAYMTWEKEANEFEDRLRDIWVEAQRRPSRSSTIQLFRRLRECKEDLQTIQLPYEEWEVLFRAHTLIARTLLEHLVEAIDPSLGNNIPASPRPENKSGRSGQQFAPCPTVHFSRPAEP